MKRTDLGVLVLGVSVLLGIPLALLLSQRSEAAAGSLLAPAEAALRGAFAEWASRHERGGGDRHVQIGLGWVKGLSLPFTRGRGEIDLDLIAGTARVKVEGLDSTAGGEVWLIDKRKERGSFLPDPRDPRLHLGSLTESGTLEATFDPEELQDFQIDLAVVTRRGELATRPALLYGINPLFQKLYTRERLRSVEPSPSFSLPSMLPLGIPRATGELSSLATSGETLFFQETFGGNGRTCGTCHPAENNFTIDPKFISRLPANDPLFVAERRPELAQLERPRLLRRLGLIVVNPDGLEEPIRKFVMRSVPHLLGLATSVQAPPEFDPSLPNQRRDGTTVPPVQRTGWSGDGAPGGGSLLEFSVGAVVQHFTRSLHRIPGQDFRLPTMSELEALEAFQLTLGRQQDLSLFTLQLRDSRASQGQAIFNNAGFNPAIPQGKCVQCHSNAGANVIVFDPASGLAEFNPTFIVGTENFPDQPARRIDPTLPRDGGFGTQEACDLDGDGLPDPGVFGNCSFNVPSVVEAANTGPFFHNNFANTLEAAIDFYNSDAFNDTVPAQQIGGIHLAPDDEAKIAAFLRVINALESLRQAVEREDSVPAASRKDARRLLQLAAHNTEDAIAVLEASHLHPDAVARLYLAAAVLRLGEAGALPVDLAVEKAKALQEKARMLMQV